MTLDDIEETKWAEDLQPENYDEIEKKKYILSTHAKYWADDETLANLEEKVDFDDGRKSWYVSSCLVNINIEVPFYCEEGDLDKIDMEDLAVKEANNISDNTGMDLEDVATDMLHDRVEQCHTQNNLE